MRLRDSDIASLTDGESTLVDESGDSPNKSTSRKVDNNIADDWALQFNAPIGTEGFREVDHLVITNNKALKEAIQVNHAVSQGNFEMLMAARLARR